MSRSSLALVLLVAGLSPPAHAGWSRAQFVDSGGQPVAPPAVVLKAVAGARPAAGQPARVWAVGGSASASFIVRSDDGFHTATEVLDCSSIVNTLNTVWVAPGGTALHAFGLANSHAGWDGTSWSCAKFTPPAGVINVNVFGAAFQDAANGYVVGGASPGPGFVGRWTNGTLIDATPGGLLGAANAVGYATPSGRYDFTSASKIYRVGAASFHTGASTFNALGFFGDSALAVGATAVGLRRFDASTEVVSLATTVPDFAPLNGVALTAKGFAVVVGATSATEGAIAQSLDGGANWIRVPLTGFTPAVRVLNGVACFDENTCVAVGGVAGEAPEFLFYENQAPSAAVTVNGGPTSVAVHDDEQLCLSALVSDAEGDAASWVWHGSAVEGLTVAAPPCFTPAVSCATQTLTGYSLELTDGRASGSQSIGLTVEHRNRPPSAPVLAPPPAAGTTYTWTAGQTYVLSASATADCSRPLTFQWSTAGGIPAPSVSGTQATFDLSSLGCGGVSGTFAVDAVDSDTSLSPVRSSFSVDVPLVTQKPVLALGPGTSVVVPPGGQATVSVSASHCSGSAATDFDYEWSCRPGVNQPSLVFASPGDSCGETIPCTVTVTPKLAGQPAEQAAFTVELQPASGAPTLTFDYSLGSGSPVQVPPGSTLIVTPRATGMCRPSLGWTCTGAPNPPAPGSAASWDFANPAGGCTAASYHCDVTATPEGAGSAITSGFDVTLAIDPAPTSAQTTYVPASTPPVRVARGGSVQAQVSASNRCASAFDWTWDCDGTWTDPAPGATQLALTHPGDNCAERTVRCTATATPSGGLPASSTQVEVVFEAVPAAIEDLILTGPTFDGSEVSASVSAKSACPLQAEFAWTAVLLSAPEVTVASGSGGSFRFAPSVCAEDVAEVRVEERQSGLVRTARVALPAPSGPPVIATPGSGTYSPSAEPLLDCAAPAPVRILPSVSASCLPKDRWRQVSGPQVQVEELPGHGLEVRVPAEAVGEALGRTAVFELTVESANGTSAPQLFEVRFVPPQFVQLEHVADRRLSAVGEPVGLEVRVRSGCLAALPQVIDLHVSLTALEYVRGSGAWEGQALEPERVGGELVFPAVSVPAAGEVTTLVYSARRRAGGTGSGASRALAYLAADPTLLVSVPAAARAEGAGVGVPALSCQCGQVGGEGAWLVLVALAALRGRRRAGKC